MEIAEIEVSTAKSLTLPFQEVQVMPIGDVQIGSGDVDIERLRKQIEWANEQTASGGPPVYFVGMGDYIDLLSPSNRAAWRATRLYDSAQQAMNDKAEEYVRQFLEAVEGTAGRWLGLLHGHHYFAFEDGTTSDTRIAQALKAPYLGTCAFIRLKFDNRVPGATRKSTHRMTCTLWVHHGEGNGLMPHTPLNKLYHVSQSFEADVYLIGHQTKKPAVKIPRLELNSAGQLIAKTKIMAGTGGFSKGYNVGSRATGNPNLPQGGYVEQGMMNPVSLGSPLIKIRPVEGPPARLDLNIEI